MDSAASAPILFVKQLIDECIDATDEKRGNGSQSVNGLPRRDARFQRLDIFPHDALVVFQRKQQGDVDIDALLKELTDRFSAFDRPRNLHHDIGAIHAIPEPTSFNDCAVCAARLTWRHFNRDKAIRAIECIIDGAKDIAGGLHVPDGDGFKAVGWNSCVWRTSIFSCSSYALPAAIAF